MTRNRKKLITVLLLGLCLFCSCGERAEEQPSRTGDESFSGQAEAMLKGGTVDDDVANQLLGIDAEQVENDGDETVAENVILVGALSKDYSSIYRYLTAFNQSQSEYKAEIKKYDDRDHMFLDLVRGKGCDLLVLMPNYLSTLSDKGALEDLAPYFERSSLVCREDLFDCVWETGMAGEKMVGVIPEFFVNAILTEKGSTDKGAWTVEEYLALAERYPDIPVSPRARERKVEFWLSQELALAVENFVDWEERTCSFDSEEFVALLTRLKDYLNGLPPSEKTNGTWDRATNLYRREVLTLPVLFGYNKHFSCYKDLRDAFAENYELAGIPNREKEVKYTMYFGNAIYSMNAASGKKEAAWLFLEYMLSEEHQREMAQEGPQAFPARRDLVERLLQEETEADPEDMSYGHVNSYTGESIRRRGEFTQEDVERVLYILDHSCPPPVLEGYATEFYDIFYEELKPFDAGDKTARETARSLQNRVSLYLSE